jgi:cobalt-zinc-cadmium efflux system protein
LGHGHARGGSRQSGRLAICLAITIAFLVVEVTVGFWTGSLVLIADAGHMLTDAAGLALSLGAIWLSQRPANERKTYGYYRSEILGALANSLLLFAVSAYIFYEAFQRFTNPPDISSAPLLVVASLGLGVNAAGAWLLASGAKDSMNVQAVFLDMWQDALGSVAAISAGVIILTTGWQYADPILAAGVGLLILPRTWKLLKSALDVLFEGTPVHMNTGDMGQAVMTVPGVAAVHDLHVWTVTSGFVSLSAHVETDQSRDQHDILVDLRRMLSQRFDIDHATIQIETSTLHEELEACCGVDAGNTTPAHAAHHS